MINTWVQSVYLTDGQISFKGMTGTTAGNGTQCGIGFATDGFDTLTGPQQERKLRKAHILLRIDTGTAAAFNQLWQIVQQGKLREIFGQFDPVSVFCHGRFDQRRLRQLQVLIRLKVFVIWIVIAVAVHKITAFCN